MPLRWLVVVLAVVLVAVAQPVHAADWRVGRTVASGLQAPWSMALLPDGSALVSERDSARIKRVSRDGKVTTVGTVRGVRPGGEGGLLGIAVAPGPNPDAVYAYLTGASDNRVVRINWNGRRLGAQRPIFTGIPKSSIHNGGRILIDGKTMFIATGDAADPDLAQDRRNLAGKILRITLDGRPAPGNPFPNSPVYSLGHRNVQGLALDRSGQLWASEFGARDVDELNLITPGSNYGWPICEGSCADPRFVNPKAEWSPTSTASPSGMAIVGNDAFVASLRGRVLWRVPLRGADAGKPVAVQLGDLGRLRDVVAAPGGALWLVTNNTDGRGSPRPGDDRIVRVVRSP
jgi:glucose/arabinose dehydrogenase